MRRKISRAPASSGPARQSVSIPVWFLPTCSLALHSWYISCARPSCLQTWRGQSRYQHQSANIYLQRKSAHLGRLSCRRPDTGTRSPISSLQPCLGSRENWLTYSLTNYKVPKLTLSVLVFCFVSTAGCFSNYLVRSYWAGRVWLRVYRSGSANNSWEIILRKTESNQQARTLRRF